jgi:hypothetical protein
VRPTLAIEGQQALPVDLSITSLSLNAIRQPSSDLLQQPRDLASVTAMPNTSTIHEPVSTLQKSPNRQGASFQDHTSQDSHCKITDNAQTSPSSVRFNVSHELPRQASAAQDDIQWNPRTAFRLTGRKATPFLARKASVEDDEDEA